MASVRENMENRVASSVEDANASTYHVSTVLRSLCQMLKCMKYHIYQPHLLSNYTFLLSIHPGFFIVFSHVQIWELTFATPCSGRAASGKS